MVQSFSNFMSHSSCQSAAPVRAQSVWPFGLALLWGRRLCWVPSSPKWPLKSDGSSHRFCGEIGRCLMSISFCPQMRTSFGSSMPLVSRRSFRDHGVFGGYWSWLMQWIFELSIFGNGTVPLCLNCMSNRSQRCLWIRNLPFIPRKESEEWLGF